MDEEVSKILSKSCEFVGKSSGVYYFKLSPTSDFSGLKNTDYMFTDKLILYV